MSLSLPLPLYHSGKVRDTYLVPGHPELLAVVASDRISTHNVVHKTPIPGKGEILTAQTVFFATMVLKVPTHLVASGEAVLSYLGGDVPEGIERRTLIVKKRTPTLREFVWRYYNTGSLAKALAAGTDPYGLNLRHDLPLMAEFPVPVLTPTLKSENDEPVRLADTVREFPQECILTERAVREAAAFLRKCGITLIDTKLEADRGMLVDEFFTGDSSRFAETSEIQEGCNPPFLDKEPIRQVAERRWGGGPKVPLAFSEEETETGIAGYHKAFEMIVGISLSRYQHTHLSQIFI